MKDPQALLMTAVADSLPIHILAKQVKIAIDDYLEERTEDRLGYLTFVMQIFLMKHIMQRGNIDAEQLMKDMDKHNNIMDLFKENHN